jgi:hypothetical protein
LPTADDIARIRPLSTAALITARVTRPQPPRRPSAVNRQINDSRVALRNIATGFGAIRCRRPNAGGGPWCIEFVGSAGPL